MSRVEERNPMADPNVGAGRQPMEIHGEYGTWKSGFCGCSEDSKSCFTSCCCPCIQYGENKMNFLGLEKSTSDCLTYCCLAMCGLNWIVGCGLRGEIRKKYQIAGSSVGDCFAHCCCACCALSQEGREIKARTGA